MLHSQLCSGSPSPAWSMTWCFFRSRNSRIFFFRAFFLHSTPQTVCSLSVERFIRDVVQQSQTAACTFVLAENPLSPIHIPQENYSIQSIRYSYQCIVFAVYRYSQSQYTITIFNLDGLHVTCNWRLCFHITSCAASCPQCMRHDISSTKLRILPHGAGHASHVQSSGSGSIQYHLSQVLGSCIVIRNTEAK